MLLLLLLLLLPSLLRLLALLAVSAADAAGTYRRSVHAFATLNDFRVVLAVYV